MIYPSAANDIQCYYICQRCVRVSSAAEKICFSDLHKVHFIDP